MSSADSPRSVRRQISPDRSRVVLKNGLKLRPDLRGGWAPLRLFPPLPPLRRSTLSLGYGSRTSGPPRTRRSPAHPRAMASIAQQELFFVASPEHPARLLLRMATVEVRFAFSSVDPDPTSRESPGQAPHRLDGLDGLRGLEEARRRSCRDGCELHPSPVEFGDSRRVGDPRMSEVPEQLAQPAQPKVPIFTSAVHGGSLKGTDVSEHS